ncbi:MAG: methyl-accepting chemotaxis protein [Chloroflexaceae bacterium]
MEQTLNRLPTLEVPELRPTLRDNVRLLNMMIIGALTLAIILMLLILTLNRINQVGTEAVAFALLITLITTVVTVPSYYYLRRKRVLFAGRWFFYGLTLVLAFSAALIGGVGSPLIMGYFIPIVAAGLIGESTDSLRVGAVAIGGYFLLFVGQFFLGLEPIIPLTRGSGFIFLPVFLLSGGGLAFLAWVTSRDLTNALLESHQRARELLDQTEQIMEKNIQQVELGSELSAAAAELQATSQQQASGAAEQASAVSQISTTIEELGSTARQIAQTTEHVAQAAQHTLENLSNGQGAVDESIQAMERIRSRMQDVAARVLSLGERSQQIGEIIDLIDDISDETHLLALNAAIEAAGAGEHGRRFAVVAAEVKSLANRTLAAAKEVKGVIAEIRQATNSAVLAAEEGGKEVEHGVELAHRAGQVMDTVVMVAERTAQSAAEIGLATAQQQSASEQVVETMREIAEVARQSAGGAQQMAESSAMLTAIADRLHGIAQS